MRVLTLYGKGRLGWADAPAPRLQADTDAIVRPVAVGRCDGDSLPIHRHVSRAMQVGLALGVLDPAVGSICGKVPFRGPLSVGHECVAEVVETGGGTATGTSASTATGTRRLAVGDLVVVPWSISCGECTSCRRGLTSKCEVARQSDTGLRTLAAYGFGSACGDFGGMASDLVRVPFAEHMLVALPPGMDPLRAVAASDNLADAWRCIVPYVQALPRARVLVIGGAAQSIGIYAAGLAVAHGASEVVYADPSSTRRRLAEEYGATCIDAQGRPRDGLGEFDIVVEASSSTAGLETAIRSTAPGGTCTAVGYYVRRRTSVPLMHMYAQDITLHLGISHPRAVMPDLLEWLGTSGFAAERIITAEQFDDGPRAYARKCVKLALVRDRVA